MVIEVVRQRVYIYAWPLVYNTDTVSSLTS
jgi:hypothetical protein